MTVFKIILDFCFLSALLLCADSDRRIHEIPVHFLWLVSLPGLIQFGWAIGSGTSLLSYLSAIPMFMVLLAFWHFGQIGGGDVKLMTLICFYQGFFLTVTGFGFTLFVLGIICLCRMVRLKRKSKTESAEPGKRNDLRFCIPIAPPLALGCVCTMAIQYMVMALKSVFPI